MIQVDEESCIRFFDGNQGPKQCLSQCECLSGARVFNCVLPAGHEGLHESFNGDTVWREHLVRDVQAPRTP